MSWEPGVQWSSQGKINKYSNRGCKLHCRHINLSTQSLSCVSAGLGMKTLTPSMAQKVITHRSPLRHELLPLVRTEHPCLSLSSSPFPSFLSPYVRSVRVSAFTELDPLIQPTKEKKNCSTSMRKWKHRRTLYFYKSDTNAPMWGRW